jgi:predicted RNase H-like HicB family nuclease
MPAATAREYLSRPYGRVVVPETDGTFRAEIIEFPGCIATGDTAAKALSSLEDVAESWLEATLAKGQRVPDPIEGSEFSGKLVVRLGKDLHRRAAHMAARQGVSLNQFIVNGVAEQIGNRMAVSGTHHVLVPSRSEYVIHVASQVIQRGALIKFVSSAKRESERVDA